MAEDEGSLLVLSDVLLQWVGEVNETEIQGVDRPYRDTFIKETMNVQDETLQELQGVCSISSLTCDGEPEEGTPVLNLQEFYRDIPDRINLVTPNMTKSELKKPERKKSHSLYLYLDEPIIHSLKAMTAVEEEHRIKIPDLLINIQIYLPYDTTGKCGNKNMNLHSEFQVIGQQPLTALRDCIECTSDKVILGEFSENPSAPQDTVSKDVYKSAFFFIENVFYDDLRDTSAIRYSQDIIDWAKKPGRGLPEYQQKNMENTFFRDLSVTMGKPYLYQHQGNCEHIIVISDIKLVHPQDCQDLREYPLRVAHIKRKQMRCCVCLNNEATWLSTGFILSPDHTNYYCTTCFHAFHYDEQGNKLASFDAYPVVF